MSYISSLAGWQRTCAALPSVLPQDPLPPSTGILADTCRSLEQIHLLLQVFGPESSGKTTLALHAMAAVQKQGGTALLVDAEHAFDPLYSKVRPHSVVPRWQPVGTQAHVCVKLPARYGPEGLCETLPAGQQGYARPCLASLQQL